MRPPKDYRRYWCADCGIKPQSTAKANKHRRNTEHRVTVDKHATQCAIDWARSKHPPFYDRVVARDTVITHHEI